ncbi:unnamed protein product [Gadus morhua 'NCC']
MVRKRQEERQEGDQETLCGDSSSPPGEQRPALSSRRSRESGFLTVFLTLRPVPGRSWQRAMRIPDYSLQQEDYFAVKFLEFGDLVAAGKIFFGKQNFSSFQGQIVIFCPQQKHLLN